MDPVIENPDVIGINELDSRASFFPYNSESLAKANNLTDADNYLKIYNLP